MDIHSADLRPDKETLLTKLEEARPMAPVTFVGAPDCQNTAWVPQISDLNTNLSTAVSVVNAE